MSASRSSAALLRSFLIPQSRCRTIAGIGVAWQPQQRQRVSRSPRLKASFATSSSSAAAADKRPPSRPTTLLFSPTQETIEDAELDVEVLPPDDARIELTDRAAEQLRTIATREENPSVALRISVESGGCHGYQYAMELTSERQPDDYQFAHPAVQPSNIVVDAVSMPLLKGSTVDFATELIGSSFRVTDNPQAKGSGCGCGVSWELKV
ncbi:hypothetical protein BD410DRAFT_795178 [Rickenella mellea]|uniref:Core domain-containing protein n=1 Tax=Rickenella mellea TaxID=50990 RepID=A0A4Y7PQ30_9AGAM|nr:hypothetical protein BD410DRAFT_795178 [Rickenella mellea]